MNFTEKMMSPIPTSLISTSALAPARIIIQELRYIDIIYMYQFWPMTLIYRSAIHSKFCNCPKVTSMPVWQELSQWL